MKVDSIRKFMKIKQKGVNEQSYSKKGSKYQKRKFRRESCIYYLHAQIQREMGKHYKLQKLHFCGSVVKCFIIIVEGKGKQISGYLFFLSCSLLPVGDDKEYHFLSHVFRKKYISKIKHGCFLFSVFTYSLIHVSISKVCKKCEKVYSLCF